MLVLMFWFEDDFFKEEFLVTMNSHGQICDMLSLVTNTKRSQTQTSLRAPVNHSHMLLKLCRTVGRLCGFLFFLSVFVTPPVPRV